MNPTILERVVFVAGKRAAPCAGMDKVEKLPEARADLFRGLGLGSDSGVTGTQGGSKELAASLRNLSAQETVWADVTGTTKSWCGARGSQTAAWGGYGRVETKGIFHHIGNAIAVDIGLRS